MGTRTYAVALATMLIAPTIALAENTLPTAVSFAPTAGSALAPGARIGAPVRRGSKLQEGDSDATTAAVVAGLAGLAGGIGIGNAITKNGGDVCIVSGGVSPGDGC